MAEEIKFLPHPPIKKWMLHTIVYTILLLILASSVTMNWLFITRAIYMGDRHLKETDTAKDVFDPPDPGGTTPAKKIKKKE